jgi:hypothetical protein
VNTPLFRSPNIATFTVGSPGSFAISANEGTISLIGPLPPNGLLFTGGNPAGITGTPAPGSGGQYQLTLKDFVRGQVSVYQSLTLNDNEAPAITNSNKATFATGFPGSFVVTTTGFPSVSAERVTLPWTPPTSPNEGKGMYFTVTGLPASLTANYLDPQGFATGTLTIQGTPLPGDAGTRSVQITARNGVGKVAEQTLTLNIVKPAEAAPASGTACDGAYTGVFKGDVFVSSGQNCMFVGGGVTGRVDVFGGDFTLSRAKVSGDVIIQGPSGFFISDSEISGVVTIQNVSTRVTRNALCGTTIGGSVIVALNSIPIEIGSAQASCPGNSFGGFVDIEDNHGPIGVYNNRAQALICGGNISIAGGDNSAGKKIGQCLGF